jgi:hypothetical protein
MNLPWTKLGNSFILISGCSLFFIMITEQKKRKVSSIQEKMDILAQVDANKETCVALATRWGTEPSSMNAIFKNKKDTEKCHAQCGSVSG